MEKPNRKKGDRMKLACFKNYSLTEEVEFWELTELELPINCIIRNNLMGITTRKIGNTHYLLTFKERNTDEDSFSFIIDKIPLVYQKINGVKKLGFYVYENAYAFILSVRISLMCQKFFQISIEILQMIKGGLLIIR